MSQLAHNIQTAPFITMKSDSYSSNLDSLTVAAFENEAAPWEIVFFLE